MAIEKKKTSKQATTRRNKSKRVNEMISIDRRHIVTSGHVTRHDAAAAAARSVPHHTNTDVTHTRREFAC